MGAVAITISILVLVVRTGLLMRRVIMNSQHNHQRWHPTLHGPGTRTVFMSECAAEYAA